MQMSCKVFHVCIRRKLTCFDASTSLLSLFYKNTIKAFTLTEGQTEQTRAAEALEELEAASNDQSFFHRQQRWCEKARTE